MVRLSAQKEIYALSFIILFLIPMGGLSIAFIGNNSIAYEDHYFNPELKQSYQVNDYTFNLYTGSHIAYNFDTNQLEVFLTIEVSTDPILSPNQNNTVFFGNSINSTWIYVGGELLDMQRIDDTTDQVAIRQDQPTQIHRVTLIHRSTVQPSIYYDLSGEITTTTRLWSNDLRLVEADQPDFEEFLITEPVEIEFDLSTYDPIFIHIITSFVLFSLVAIIWYYYRMSLADLSNDKLEFLTKFLPHVITAAIVGVLLPFQLFDLMESSLDTIIIADNDLPFMVLVSIGGIIEFLVLCLVPYAIERLYRRYHYYGYETGQLLNEPVFLFNKMIYNPPPGNEINTYAFDPNVKRLDWPDHVILTIFSRELLKYQLIWIGVSIIGIFLLSMYRFVVSSNLSYLILLVYYIWVYLRKVIIFPVNHPDLK